VTKPLRVTALVATSILCLVGLALCVIYVAQLRLERRSEALLNDVGSLKLEVSTAADVMAIVQKYQGFGITDGWNSGCGPYDSSYAAVIRNDSINRIGMRFPILRFAVRGRRRYDINQELAFPNEKGHRLQEAIAPVNDWAFG
jgi:hypothetical protein